MGPTTFPPPRLHRILRDISNAIHRGRVFQVVRGLPVEMHTREGNFGAYAGISNHRASVCGAGIIDSMVH